ncbi:GAF domain-containing protein [Nocardioides sp.]|uniref:GAF domain-containing protein n=1 Tax=Nocardioides sp. TaxID=35761 RepID=UPI003D09AAF9
MEPVPETDVALDEYMRDDDPRDDLLQMGRLVRRIVPQCVAMSMTMVEDELTFTLVARDRSASRVPAQRAIAEDCIESSLSLPIVESGRVVAGLSLYAATADAFDGHHEELARALGASVSGVVSNGDLSFSTRRRAREAPQQLADRKDVDVTVGLLAADRNLDLRTARQLLAEIAIRAGVTAAAAARVLRFSRP